MKKNIIVKALLALCAAFILPSAAAAQENDYLKHVTSFDAVVECEKINIHNEALNFYLDAGDTQMLLEAAAVPRNCSDPSITFSSSAPDIISIDENGMMTSMNRGGEAIITVSCGNVTRDVTVSVIRGVTGILLETNDMTFYADRPVPAKAVPVISPSDATNKNVTWESEDSTIASVDENGVITPCGTGTVSVTATTEDGGFSAVCTVRVKIYDVPTRAVFLTNAPDAIRVGTSYTLGTYIYPQDARNKALTWSSSDSAIAEVTSQGELKGIAEGMAVITCRASNGFEDSFTVSCVPDDGTPFTYNIVSPSVEQRIAELTMPVFYNHYSISLDSAVSTQMKTSPVLFGTTSSSASRTDVERCMNPQNYTSGSAKYQFLDLSVSNGVSASSLDTFFTGKGVLSGKGSVFVNAAQSNSISEIYLAVHAALESGNGTSELASGVEYNGTVVYNLFGIGAIDESPVQGGAKYAYEQGWTTVDAAIYGGAQWISRNYINNGQNTLYAMRWNPKSPGTHQYASDVEWAIKQAQTIRPLIEACPNAVLSFDFPVYSGQSEAVISYE